MPTIEVNRKDLEMLVGKKLPQKQLEECLMFVKGEIDDEEKGVLKVDVKETNRPDLWSTEGIAREIRTRLGTEKGIRKYNVEKAKIGCTIEKSVEKSRPFIACAVVKGVKVSEELLIQMIQLQEKVGMTYGRKRKETGIGLYDYDIMKPPIFYRGYKDKDIEFVPLEYKVKMKPSEILAEHPKGKEYAHLLKGVDFYPIVIDSAGVVASMPPIINSQTTGKVTEKTRNLFLEVTGFNWEIVNTALKVMCMALADRGGKIEAVKINFPKTKTYPSKSIETPFFATKKTSIDIDYANKISGLGISAKEMISLIQKAGMNAKQKGRKIEVEYPDYRADILHPVDVIEDILIGYGYNKIPVQKVEMSVIGSERKESLYLDKARDVCVGMGLQEVLTFVLSSKEKQEKMIGFEKEEFVEIANPVSANWTIMRKNIYPELLEFLAKNKHYEYPQNIFEIGKTLELDKKSDTGTKESARLCIVMTNSGYGFTHIKSVFGAVCRELGKKCQVKETKHPSLKEGRSALISGDSEGILGELKQEIAANFGLHKPIIVLEMDL